MVHAFSENPHENYWWNLTGILSSLNCDERIVHAVSQGYRNSTLTALMSPDWKTYVRRLFRPNIFHVEGELIRMRKYGHEFEMEKYRTNFSGEPEFEITGRADCAFTEPELDAVFTPTVNDAFWCWQYLVLYSRYDFRFWRELQPLHGLRKPLTVSRICWSYLHFEMAIMMNFHVITVDLWQECNGSRNGPHLECTVKFWAEAPS